MKRFIFFQTALLFFSFVATFAQFPLDVATGIHYGTNVSQNVEKNLLEEYWGPSLDIGVRSNVQMADWINIVPSVFYNHYLFNSYYQTGNYSDTERVFVSSSGESANVIRATVELQLIDQSSKFAKPYCNIGGGYVHEHLGTIHGRVEYMKYVKYSKDIKLSDNSYFAYTIGVGGIVSLFTDFVMDFSVKYYSNAAERSYCLFDLGIAYNLLKGF